MVVTRLRRATGLGPGKPLVTVLAVALAARVLAACVLQWWIGCSGTHRLCVFPDTEYYWLLARTIRAGTTYEVVEWGNIHHLALRTPGYPLFLAACQTVLGESTLAVRLVQAALGTASVWLVYRLARQFEPEPEPPDGAEPGVWTRPVIAAALAAVDPYSVAMSELLLSEALFIPLMLLLLWGLAALWRTAQEQDGSDEEPSTCAQVCWRWRSGVPVSWRWRPALPAERRSSPRPSFALFLPAALLGWLIACIPGSDNRRRSAAWRGSVLALVGAALVMSPWWVRNARIYGRFVPTSVWFGASLYDGLNPNATGASNMSFRDEPEFRTLSEVDQDATLARRAWDFARNNPARVLELAAIKLGRYWSPWLNAEEYRSPALAVVSAVVVIPLYMLILVGAWDRRRDLRALVILAGPLLYFCAVHLVFVSSVRYRFSGALAAMPLAAIGFESITRRVKRRHRKTDR